MPKINYKVLIMSIIVSLIVGSVTVDWIFTKDNSELIRDGVTLAKHRWHVEAQRTYINKNSWYRKNVMCPNIISNGGYEIGTRCYYAPNTYEQLSRSIINTQLIKNNSKIFRKTPYYRYGSRGSYAGHLEELFLFKETQDFEEFPDSYNILWTPKDTRNYKMVWRVWDLKNQPLSDGNYTNCKYTAEFVKIDLGSSCKELDYAEVKGNRIWFYFKPQRNIQMKELSIVDPAPAVFLFIKTVSDGVIRTTPFDLENGTDIIVIANTTSGNITVCISADHPDVGTDVSCGINSTEYNFSVNSGSNTFSDGSTIKNITWNASGNKTVSFVAVRNNSEITRSKIDVEGFNKVEYCFQVSANTSTECSNPSNGTYSSTTPNPQWNDLNFSTFYNHGSSPNNTTNFTINFTKLLGLPTTNTSLIRVKYQNQGEAGVDSNFSIPLGCYNQDPIQVFITIGNTVAPGATAYTNASCYDGSRLLRILEDPGSSGFTSPLLYEVAMNWDLSSYPKNLLFDFNNDSVINQATFGELRGNTIHTDEFNGSVTTLNLTYNDSGVLTFALKLPNNINVSNATFNLSGEQNTFPKGISEAQSKESDGTLYQPYSPGVAHKDGTELLYGFGGDCSTLCGDNSQYNTTAEITIGGGLSTVTYKTNVPYTAGVGNCVVYDDVGIRFYVIGGWDSTNYHNSTYRYRTVPETWTKRADIPLTKAFAQCVLKDDAIYIGGGYTDGVWNKTFWKFNITANTWINITDLPDGKEQGWAEVLNETHLLFYGGTRRGSTATGGKTYEYNIVTDNWTQRTPSPSIWTNSGGKVGDTIYLYGGVLGGASSTAKTIYRYNQAYGNWTLMDTNISGSMYENDCDEKDEHIICLGSGGFGFGQFQESIYHYPFNIGIQVLDSPNVSYTDTGDINNTSRNIGDIGSEINTALIGCTADNETFCYISIFIQNIGSGDLTFENLNITTPLSTIDVGTANITCDTDYCNQTLRIQNDKTGILEISNINSTWLGTHNITWNVSTQGNGSLDPNSTTGITTIYHSKFLRTLPYTWTSVIFFMPQNFNQKNISAFGQSDLVSIINITNQAQDKTFNLSTKLNASTGCVNITISRNSNKTNITNTSTIVIITNTSGHTSYVGNLTTTGSAVGTGQYIISNLSQQDCSQGTCENGNNSWNTGFNNADPANTQIEWLFNVSSLNINGSNITNITLNGAGCWHGESDSSCNGTDDAEFAVGTEPQLRVYIYDWDTNKWDNVSCVSGTHNCVLGGYNITHGGAGGAGPGADYQNYTFSKNGSFTDGHVNNSGIIKIMYNITGTAAGASPDVQGVYDFINISIKTTISNTTTTNFTEIILTNNSYTFLDQVTLNELRNYWMWADLYNCNASVTPFLKPKVLWKSCCDTCVGC